MSAKKITEQAAKWGTTGLLTAGVIVSTGLLSFCGMLFIHPSLVLAWIAFGLAGFVDGEVYKQDIARGIDNLKLLSKQGVDILIIKSLEEQAKKLLKEDAGKTLNWFEKAYLEQKKYIADFEHKKLTAEQKKQKQNAIKRLHRMQKFFVKCVLSSNNNEGIENLALPIRKKLPSFKRKMWYLRASIPVCLGAGAGFGFATASSLSIALVGIGMTAALSVTIWPLAALACLGYAFLIYHTIADIICNDTFKKWGEKVKVWFTRIKTTEGKEDTIKYGLRVIGISLLLAITFSIGVIATLATAGTWWMAVKNGALLLPLFAAAANHIRNILVPLAATTNLIFTFKNSFKSVKNILAVKPIKALKKKKEEIKEFFKNEPLPQLLNPFRAITALISLPFMFIVFVGHVIAVGLMGDRLPGLNAAEAGLITGVGAVADTLTDAPYIFPHDHDNEEKPKQPCDHHESKKEKDHKHSHDHAEPDAEPDPEHNHNHGLIAEWVLKVTLSPLLFLSAVYSFAVTAFPKESNGKQNFKNELKKSFGIKNQEIYMEKIPEPKRDVEWINREISLRFEKHRSKEKDDHEKNSLNSLEEKIKQNINDPFYTVHANGMFSNKHSKEFASKVIEDYFPNPLHVGA